MTGPTGTQPARTALAWQRTGLGMLLVAGLLLRGAAAHEALLLVVPAGVVAVAALVVLGVLGPRRGRAGEVAVRTGGDARSPGAAALVTGLVVLTALCALASELLRS
jgi:hypothetical protein